MLENRRANAGPEWRRSGDNLICPPILSGLRNHEQAVRSNILWTDYRVDFNNFYAFRILERIGIWARRSIFRA